MVPLTLVYGVRVLFYGGRLLNYIRDLYDGMEISHRVYNNKEEIMNTDFNSKINNMSSYQLSVSYE